MIRCAAPWRGEVPEPSGVSRRPPGARPSAHREVLRRPGHTPCLTATPSAWEHHNVILTPRLRSRGGRAVLPRGSVSAGRVPVSARARWQAATPDSAPRPCTALSCWRSPAAEGFPPTAAVHECHPAAGPPRTSTPGATVPQSPDASLTSSRLLDPGASAPGKVRGRPMTRTATGATPKP